jgi:hypothetical protein
MFTSNKYTKWYYNIIDNRKNNQPNQHVYQEKHHIIPKSLGGSNKNENIVSITAKEHFICHMLLVRMTTGRNRMRMSYALRMMMVVENQNQNRHKIGAALYNQLKREIHENIKPYVSGKDNGFYGKKHSKEAKEKMQIARASQKMRSGWNHSEESKQKMREANHKQFKDPAQIEIRRKKCKSVLGKKIYHDIAGNTKYFIEGCQPNDWIRGRYNTKGGSV